MASRRPEIFLYQATSQPIVLGELPVVPVLPADEYAEFVGVELIEGGSPFNHYVPEVVIAPCWVQDFSIPPLDRELLGADPFLMHQVAPPVVYPDSYFMVDVLEARDDRLPGMEAIDDGNQFDPSAAAHVVVPVFKLDFLHQSHLQPVDRELISDIGYSPLRNVVIMPLSTIASSELLPVVRELLGAEVQLPVLVIPTLYRDWLPGGGEISPREIPLLGVDAQAPILFIPQPVIDWLVQQVDLPAERWEILEATISHCPVHVPDIHGFYEGLSRAAVQELRPLIGENFHVQITISAESISVRICRVTSEPAIGMTSVDAAPAITVDEVEGAPAIRIDSVDGDSVC